MTFFSDKSSLIFHKINFIRQFMSIYCILVPTKVKMKSRNDLITFSQYDDLGIRLAEKFSCKDRGIGKF